MKYKYEVDRIDDTRARVIRYEKKNKKGGWFFSKVCTGPKEYKIAKIEMNNIKKKRSKC